MPETEAAVRAMWSMSKGMPQNGKLRLANKSNRLVFVKWSSLSKSLLIQRLPAKIPMNQVNPCSLIGALLSLS